MKKICLLLLFLCSCVKKEKNNLNSVDLQEANSKSTAFIPLQGKEFEDSSLLDIRGVGDTGYAKNARTLYADRIPNGRTEAVYSPNADYSGDAIESKFDSALD